MSRSILLLVLIIHNCLCYVINEPGCSIDVTEHDPEPVVVSDGDFKFLYALPGETHISIPSKQTVLISCPGGELSVGGTVLKATCIAGTVFEASGIQLTFEKLTCSKRAFHTARYTGNVCESNGTEIEIGFALDEDRFARQILICFDEILKTPLYSYYNLTKSILNHEHGIPRPFFIQDDFYDFGVSKLYSRKTQRATINQFVGLPNDSVKYVRDDSDHYLARGHLTAKADFIYAFQQSATFHYVNSAPQWQTLNGHNWEIIESTVRSYANERNSDLEVFTGVYGIVTLPHVETGEAVELYFYSDKRDGYSAMPIPAVYWKLVYNRETKEGVALVGHNNPYEKDVIELCENVSEQITWLPKFKDESKFGHCYACRVEDLKETIPYLPNLNVESLMK